MNRLNAVLPTRESERGLVSEIGGVQFATATANLNPPARESLARFSGIVASYPELSFRIEGHTDNVGSDLTNSELSLRRAISVRDYLISLGVPASNIDVDLRIAVSRSVYAFESRNCKGSLDDIR